MSGMDFFGAQTRARRNSRWLVLWFALAVCAIILIIHLGVVLLIGPQTAFTAMGVMTVTHPGVVPAHVPRMTPFWSAFFDWERLGWTALLVGGVIAVASLWKIVQISRKGGAFIAFELGGRLVARETSLAEERRLLNVVDEMSIAAGIPVPQVFVLDEEKGMNAFAAGMTPSDSVIAVTRGLLERCDRDRLQGVIGHEIGHIVSGDSRLNLRLIGVLHGILALTLIGRILLRIRDGGKERAVVFLLGLLLVLVGSIGVFFGKIIKAAISREREYLADAFSVQFTRNPDGLAGALRLMGGFGTRIEHPRAEEASHLFFGDGSRRIPLLARLFATHPPMEKRISRIENIPLAQVQKSAKSAAGVTGAASSAVMGEVDLLGLDLSGPAQIAYAQGFLASLPAESGWDAHRPGGALAVIYALLFSEAPEIRQKQLAILTERHGAAMAENVRDCAAWLTAHGARSRLPLLDLAIPALAALSAPDKQVCMQCANALIRADGRLSPSELALAHILKSALGLPRARHVLRTEKLAADISCLLALLAKAGNPDDAAARAAYQHAMERAPFGGDTPFPESGALKAEAIDAALDRIAQAVPRFRQRFLAACVAAVRHDGKITVAESELLRAFAQSLDCPAPPLLPDEDK
ncbi:MAG: M48 family metallopeptidase [Zoogloeaceae bacterium]|jgi:Zn-dependent protease with chaperone function/tellurite resistance protein|nr:M48 family metallopeptidase [Zoogloeaceae bacterium]